MSPPITKLMDIPGGADLSIVLYPSGEYLEITVPINSTSDSRLMVYSERISNIQLVAETLRKKSR